MLLEINRVDAQVEQMEEKRAKLKDMARNGRN